LNHPHLGIVILFLPQITLCEKRAVTFEKACWGTLQRAVHVRADPENEITFNYANQRCQEAACVVWGFSAVVFGRAVNISADCAYAPGVCLECPRTCPQISGHPGICLISAMVAIGHEMWFNKEL
jgi:hypothetical protein